MKILVDADACPVVDIIERVAKKYNLPVILLSDPNHQLSSDYSEVIIVDAGADAVDYALINMCEAKDIVVSQDYGVASMALTKGAYPIGNSGTIFNDFNIDQYLMSRHISAQARRSSSKHNIKGPKKRVDLDDDNFEKSLEKVIKKNIRNI